MSRENEKYSGVNGNARRVRVLSKRLEKQYGPFVPKRSRDAVEELILTVLSQATNDKNRDRAFDSLNREFTSWDEILAAPVNKIESAIRAGGLAHNKSRAIKKILGEIKSRYGSFSLDFIGKMDIGEAVDLLTEFPGVGVKTAACVLVFSFHKPVIPVDTHVHRLAGRLGLVSAKASAEQTYRVLMEIVPEELRYPFHLQLIRHGREVCKSQRPKCAECVLREMCPRYESPTALGTSSRATI